MHGCPCSPSDERIEGKLKPALPLVGVIDRLASDVQDILGLPHPPEGCIWGALDLPLVRTIEEDWFPHLDILPPLDADRLPAPLFEGIKSTEPSGG